MSTFGHRVIGKQAAQKQALKEKHNKGRFGHRVIGDVLQRKMEIADEKSEATRDAKTVISKRRKAEAEAEAARKDAAGTPAEDVVDEIEAPVTASLKEMQEALDGNPTFYENLYQSELKRADGPRKGALRMFLAYELDNLDRIERVEEITTILR